MSSNKYDSLSLENFKLYAEEVLKKIRKIREKKRRRKSWVKAVEMGRMVPGGLRELQVCIF